MAEHKFLIIGGMPKAGTTSLFHWLKRHPDIAAPPMKQTNFFVDDNYPAASPVRFNGNNLDRYLNYFSNQVGKTCLDASPDYLYNETALRIPSLLPNAKMIFITRDPVERVVSWYKYARQRGFIAANVQLDQYVRTLLSVGADDNVPLYLRALEQNRIGKYLPTFERKFGSKLLVLDFNDLRSDPLATIMRICIFADIAADYFNNGFKFEAQNVSNARSPSYIQKLYYPARRKLEYMLSHSPNLRRVMGSANKLTRRFLFGNPSTGPKQEHKMDDALIREILAASSR